MVAHDSPGRIGGEAWLARLLMFSILALVTACLAVAGLMTGELTPMIHNRSLRRDRYPLAFWILLAAIAWISATSTWLAIAAATSAW